MSDEYNLYSRSVKPEPLIEAVIGLANSPQPLNDREVSEIIDMSVAYTRAVIQLGTEIGLIKQVGDNYSIVQNVKEEARKMSPEQGFVLLNRYAQRYEPFMTFISFIDKGFNPDRSANTVKTLYSIEVPSDIIKNNLLIWVKGQTC